MISLTLDVGHTGSSPGFDPGAVGHGGTKEADVVLKVCKYLREYLSGGFNILLTREQDDASIDELWTRVDMAEKFSADLFVSVHCNAAESQQAHGYEIFVFPDDPVSQPLAKAVYNSYAEAFPDMEGRGIKEARFGVLKGEFPSILIELAFITNTVEEQFLASEEGQRAMAEAIGKGIVLWAKENS